MTRAEWVASLAERAADAERLGTLAPVAVVLRDVLHELETVDGWPAVRTDPERLLTLEEAAARLRVTPRWLRETRPPFLIEVGPKTLRVSEQRLTRWLARTAM